MKNAVKKVLAKYTPLWQHWVVGNGMGSPTVDCTGWYKGRPFAIETKAPGKRPTPRQEITLASIELAGAEIFVIDGIEGCAKLDAWLSFIRNEG